MADEVAIEVVDTIANAINLFEGVKTAYSRSKDISSLPDAFHEVPRKAVSSQHVGARSILHEQPRLRPKVLSRDEIRRGEL